MTVAVHAFPDEAEAAGRLAAALRARLELIPVHTFPDGETLPTVRGDAATVLAYRSLDRPNPKLMPLLQACDAWRRAGVRRLVLIAPYMAYLRQDAVFAPGQALSRDVLGGLLGPRFDRIVTVDAHLHRTANLSRAWNAPVTVLSAVRALASAFPRLDGRLVVGPDEEAGPWAAELGEALGAPSVTLRKTRRGDRDVRLALPPGVGLAGRAAMLVDDVCSTGATLAQAVLLLRAAGAARVDIAVTHALFDAAAEARLRAAGAGRIVSTDSCRHPTNAVPLAPVLTDALQDEVAAAVHGGASC